MVSSYQPQCARQRRTGQRTVQDLRGRLSRQQEELAPPEGCPQFSCVTLHPGSWLFRDTPEKGNKK